MRNDIIYGSIHTKPSSGFIFRYQYAKHLKNLYNNDVCPLFASKKTHSEK